MQAINHVATALILKRKFPPAPLFGLILATEVVEYLWVALNIFGIEQTLVSSPMKTVADVHLVHMPFSHSIATSALFAIVTGLIVLWVGRANAITMALALSLAIFSHVVLDLLVHAPDIAILPFIDGKKFGTGLYSNWPLLALGIETLWGVMCWRVYRGSWPLLGLILGFAVVSLPAYSVTIDAGESVLAGNESAFALLILAQMLGTTALVWLFARRTSNV